MKLAGIVMGGWGLLNFFFYFKNFRAFKQTQLMLNEISPEKALKKGGKKGKKGCKGKKEKKSEPVEESKEEVKFERAPVDEE